MSIYQNTTSFLLFPALLCLLVGSLADGVQAQDEIEMIRKYPAGYLTPPAVRSALEQAEWQAELLTLQMRKLNSDAAADRDTIESLESMVENLTSQLSMETRFVDAESRSRIVSRALEELLIARLDLAVLDQQILQAETDSNDQSGILRKRHEVEIATAEADVNSAEAELTGSKTTLKHSEALFKKGMVTQTELRLAESRVGNFELMLRKARANLDLVQFEYESQMNSELAKLRVSSAPLKARAKAAEAFLQKFVEANERQAKIAMLNRKKSRIVDRVERLEARRFELEQKMLELETLTKMVKARLKSMKKSPEEKSDQDEGDSKSDASSKAGDE